MKIGGIIGGVSWHSTKQIYEFVNTKVAAQKGRHNCAELVLVNVNLENILNAESDAEKGNILVQAAKRIEKAGGDFVALGSNGLHQYASYIENAIHIPFIHIADVTADVILRAGHQAVGLLGVKETMELDFYKSRLIKKGLHVLIPEEKDRNYIDHVLFQETGVGVVREESREGFYAISKKLVERGAECIILGCTEIDMLMDQEHSEVPLYDTTLLYSEKIADLYMDG